VAQAARPAFRLSACIGDTGLAAGATVVQAVSL